MHLLPEQLPSEFRIMADNARTTGQIIGGDLRIDGAVRALNLAADLLEQALRNRDMSVSAAPLNSVLGGAPTPPFAYTPAPTVFAEQPTAE